ncbi:MAG: ABC transporter ATP-binding protein [Saprospiraceae bacterium]|nr:ABC transporter ATP-binding protein [Saprospiraceae bacterium]
MGPILETAQLSKSYGRIRALDNLDLSINEGMVFGFLGPNGSGKTTTLALLLQVLRPSSGSFNWFGKPQWDNVRKDIGAILESPCFYPYLSGYQNLMVSARIKEVNLAAIEPVLRTVDLYERRNDPFKTYSLGMKQRLAIASALLANPRVLILDEPTNGLDPQGIVEIRNLIKKIAGTGKTIILASHLLDEVQKVCSHFMVLRQGTKLFQGSVKDALTDQSLIEVAAADMQYLAEILVTYPGVEKVERRDDKLVFKASSMSTAQINHFLIEKKIVVSHLAKKNGNLEEEFLRILAKHE